MLLQKILNVNSLIFIFVMLFQFNNLAFSLKKKKRGKEEEEVVAGTF